MESSPQDLASLHHKFTQYCLWLETHGVALGEEHLPIGSSSFLDLAKNGARDSAFSNSDNLIVSDFDGDVLGAFAPSGHAAPTSNHPSSNTACSDEDEAMLDPLFDDFAADSTDGFSGFLPELRDLVTTLPESRTLDGHVRWPAQSQLCLSANTCCFAMAKKTLKSLHIPSTTCLSTMEKVSSISISRPDAPRTAGSVLTENREAMLALSRMLRCSCSWKTQLQLVMATICDKLVTWYHAMVQSEQGFGLASPTTYPKLRGGANGRGKERVLCQPITIGDYCLDGAAEAQITGRVVLAHLRAMEFLVVALSRRIKDVNLKSSSSRQRGEQHSYSPSDEGDLFGIIRDRLITYLIGQLQGAREEAARLMSQ